MRAKYLRFIPGCYLLAALAVACHLSAETVRLKNGNILTGQVLARKSNVTVLDLGYTVLQIPNENIAAIETETVKNAAEAAPDAKASPQQVLYRRANLKTKTVKELVAQFGEGVVKVQTPKALGSGFIINENGYLITNAHVIAGEKKISVTLFLKRQKAFERRTFKNVKIVAVNPFVDLALLKLEKRADVKLTPLYFGKMDDLRAGQPVFTIGNPLGLERSVSEGILSHKARPAGGIVLLQTTAAINFGNSGGPLLNMRGEVIGVTNMKIAFIAEGLGFAIPINFVKDFLKFREAYAYDRENPNTGYTYLPPPHRPEPEQGEPVDEDKAE